MAKLPKSVKAANTRIASLKKQITKLEQRKTKLKAAKSSGCSVPKKRKGRKAKAS